jgi:nucleoside-diphosphate-sugar epimerase
MKVLVFGGSGFIGRHLVKRLRQDVEVLTFDRKPYKSTFVADIKDREAVNEAMFACNRWVNLAGLLGTSEMILRAHDAVDVNIHGALNVFDAALAYGVSGSQITVGNHWMNNPYSITKSTAERLALMYNKELDTDIRIVRGMNVFGPGQKSHPVRKLMPNVILPALKGDPISIYGDGEQIMDMIYVEDAAECLARIVLGERPPPGEVFEVGTGAITVNEIVRTVLAVTESQSEVKRVPMRPGEEPNAVVQISAEGERSLRDWTGFDISTDCTPFREAVEKTVDWYRNA